MTDTDLWTLLSSGREEWVVLGPDGAVLDRGDDLESLRSRQTARGVRCTFFRMPPAAQAGGMPPAARAGALRPAQREEPVAA